MIVPANKYTDTPRHWSPRSEVYSSGDGLLSAVREGWTIGKVVYSTEHWMRCGTRYTLVYHFELHRGGETHHMALVVTPFVVRYIAEHHLKVVPLETPLEVACVK
jgi:hypothetical protein